MDIDSLCINTIRMLSVDMVERAHSGHPGMPMGDAALAYVLWDRVMQYNPENPRWFNRDRFILSAGHGSALLYSLLYLTGYDMGLEDLKQFRQWGSKTPGHPEYDISLGIEMTTGPLGQGFATGVGMAIAERYLAEHFNRDGFPIVDYNIYAIVSDGDVMEGVSSEAASLAGHLRLGKIVYIYSDNRLTIEGSTELAFSEDVEKRFLAYGWDVRKVDGYNLDEIEEALKAAKAAEDKPSLIIARTHLGYGSPNKQDTAAAHGAPLGPEEVRATKERFSWPQQEFYVPQEVLNHMRKAIERGRSAEARWRELFERYSKEYVELARKWESWWNWEREVNFDEIFRGVKFGDIATRKASGKVLNILAKHVPILIGGSADLAPSNNTYMNGEGDFGREIGGRNLHFGVREHAMGAILNGISLTGPLVPFGGTFLVFSDYMRPSIRLAALMKAHVIYIFTHDSVGIGEDGPTHQPVEHISSLRLIPNLWVIRPADGLETAEAWKIALLRKEGPTALILTRQTLPEIDRAKYASASGLRMGGYILADSGQSPDIIIIATGSEVFLALSVYEKLVKESIKARVVSMPCVELFEEQSKEYREKVLPSSVRKRMAIEAGSPHIWYRYVGLEGDVVGLSRFGASAPGNVVFEKLGFSVKDIYERAKRLLQR